VATLLRTIDGSTRKFFANYSTTHGLHSTAPKVDKKRSLEFTEADFICFSVFVGEAGAEEEINFLISLKISNSLLFSNFLGKFCGVFLKYGLC